MLFLVILVSIFLVFGLIVLNDALLVGLVNLLLMNRLYDVLRLMIDCDLGVGVYLNLLIVISLGLCSWGWSSGWC